MFRLSSAPWRGPRGLQDVLSNMGMLITVMGLITSLLMAVAPSGPASEDPGDPDTGYVQPDPVTQEWLEQIRVDINAALIELRAKEGVAPVLPDPHMQLAVQRLTERSAVADRALPSPNNVTMLQHHLPRNSASGHAFLDAWLHSEPHAAVLLDARYSYSAVGVAVDHGKVWVAVQLSES
ncbi:CAP domain-containing protein [Corynebacterium nasicanis]|uniref:CAP domain-containing protein n=1 Tax=Corynebacterium nasicanis TaxID=1448267 RepID=A0ABW1Q944_9CORY